MRVTAATTVPSRGVALAGPFEEAVGGGGGERRWRGREAAAARERGLAQPRIRDCGGSPGGASGGGAD